MRRARALLFLCAVVIACGSGEPAAPVPAAVVDITLDRDSAYVGQAVPVHVSVYGGDGTAPTITVSDPAVLYVNGSNVRGLVAGRGWVIVSAGGARDSAAFIVLDSVARLRLSIHSATLKTRYTVSVTATLTGALGQAVPGRLVRWRSTDSTIAVSSVEGAQGGALAVRPGTASIIATSEGHADTLLLTVLPRVVSLVISPATLSLAAGDSAPVSVTALDELGAPAAVAVPVRWSPSIASYVATVDSSTNRMHAWTPNTVVTVTARNSDATGTMQLLIEAVTLAGAPSGGASSCAVSTSGTAICFGTQNQSLELGNPFVPRTLFPATITVATTAPVLASIGHAVASHTCGLTPAGSPVCWGNNSSNQVVTGASSPVPPTVVTGTPALVEVQTGLLHTCGRTSAGNAWCWGDNTSGQAGTGGTAASIVPTQVVGGTAFTQIAVGGSHTCALRADSLAMCWGANDLGQVGDSSLAPRVLVPSLVAGNHHFASLAAGLSHTCGLTAAGAAWCWGYNNGNQLGTTQPGGPCYGSATCSNVPIQAAGTWTQVSPTGGRTCALDNASALWCWGLATPAVPYLVDGTRQYVRIAGGCGLATDGRMYCGTLSMVAVPGQP